MGNNHRRTRRQRMLAWTAAFCLLAAIAPPLPGARAANPQVTLDFRAAYTQAQTSGRTPLQASFGTEGFQINQDRTAGTLLNGGTRLEYQPFGIACQVNDAGYPKHGELSVDIQVAEPGYYSVSLDGGQYAASGARAGVYIDGRYLGQYDFGGAQEQLVGETVELSGISLDSGTHTVSFRRISGGERSGTQMYPGCLTLSWQSEKRSEVVLDFLKTWDEHYLSGGNGNSPGPNSATLEEDGFQLNQSRTAASLIAGANFSYNNYGIYAAVSDQGYPKHGELAFDFQVAEAGAYQVELTGRQDAAGGNATVYIDGVYVGQYDFESRSAAPSLIGETAQLDAVSLEAGQHTVILRRISGGSERQAMFPSLIRLQKTGEARTEVHLDFRCGYDRDYLESRGETPLAATFATHGYQIDAEKSAASVTSTIPPSWHRQGIYVQIADSGYPKHSDLAISFPLEQAGKYAVQVTGGNNTDAALAEVFIDDVKIGEYNFNGEYTDVGATVQMEEQELNAGTHTVTFRRKNGEAGERLLPGSVRLIKTGEIAPPPPERTYSFRLETDKEAYNIGETLLVSAFLDGGDAYQYGAVQADIRFDSTRLALVEAETAAGEGFEINKSYGEGVVRIAYGGSQVDADAPRLLGTLALRVLDSAGDGVTKISFDGAQAAAYNAGEWGQSSHTGAEAALYDLRVTFYQGEHGALAENPTVRYVKYNTAGLYLAPDRQSTGTPPVPEAADGFRLAEKPWKGTDGVCYSAEEIQAMALTENAEFTAQYEEITFDGQVNLHAFANLDGWRVAEVKTTLTAGQKILYQNGDYTAELLYSPLREAYLCFVPESDEAPQKHLAVSSGETVTLRHGDVNADSAVDTLDAMLIHTYYNNEGGKFEALDPSQDAQILFTLDYNGDFAVDILDVSAVVKDYIGIESADQILAWHKA